MLYKHKAALKGNTLCTFISTADPSVACASSVQGGRDGPGVAWAGKGYGVKDGGGEGELCGWSCAGGELGSGWIASSTGMVLRGPLPSVSLSCLAAKGSFTGKMQ